jgi:Mrp family chromosome partitioning ATPase/capsular polysaccharide biosynthesis protein
MNETTDATAILAPLWRYKWLILVVALLVGAGSYVYYRHQPSLYSAVTEIYLGNGAEEQSQLGAGSAGKRAGAPNPTTQAALINSSIIKEAVHDQLRREHKKTPAVHAALKGKVKAKGNEKSEFITIEGEAHSARGVALLVNTTAQTYIKRQNAHYRAQVETAIALTRRQLRRIEAGQLQSLLVPAAKGSGTAKSSSGAAAAIQTATLSSKINQLESDLSVALVTQVDPAKPKESVLVSPHPRSNALFGFAIGLLLAAFGAYGLGRLDRRLRSLPAVEEVYRAQILAALRAVKRPLIDVDGHPEPAFLLREALWRLQTTMQIAGGAGNGHSSAPRTILCISADTGDGKSTLVAGLALAWGQSGKRVAVVEADFRRPVQSRLLHLSGSHGLADVLTGMIPLEDALQTVNLARPEVSVGAAPPPAPASSPVPMGSTATVASPAGSVAVLVGGTKVANPPALLGNPATGELVRSLAADFDHVLLDVPSPLQVSDAIPLLAAVDGIVIVARPGHTRAASAERLMQLLEHTPSAPVLGVVGNAVSPAEIRKYGIHAEAGQHRRSFGNLMGR